MNIVIPLVFANRKRFGYYFVLFQVGVFVLLADGFSKHLAWRLAKTSLRISITTNSEEANNVKPQQLLSSRRTRLAQRRDDTMDDSIVASVVPTTSMRPKPQQSVNCSFCLQPFPSRNALFRHLTSNSSCASLAGNGIDLRPKAPTVRRYTMVLLFGYHESTNVLVPIKAMTSEAERAGSLLLQAFKAALNDIVSAKVETSTVQILSYTQSSVAKMRHKILSQEPGCAGAGDVMVVSWRQNESLSRQPQEEASFMSRLMDRIKENLGGSNMIPGLQVKLQACKWLDGNYHIHAERACTQRLYHYLLPVSWLPNGNDIRDWWLDKTQVTGKAPFSRPHSSKRIHEERHGPNSRLPSPPESMQRFKHLLRQVESVETLDDFMETTNDVDSKKRAAGRFGTMARRERRPWHNYADPSLQGDASPNNEPVWRVIDRARVVQFLTMDGDQSSVTKNGEQENQTYDDDDVVAVLEFRGDEFMPQQIRRVVGTLVAISHGWLPSDMLDASTSATQFLETALAPTGRLYLAGLRFHFDEMRTGGKTLFESDAIGRVATRGSVRSDEDEGSSSTEDFAWTQHLLLQGTKMHRSEESKWLEELRVLVAPRIRHQLARLTTCSLQMGSADSGEKLTACPGVPAEYSLTLQLLRDIVSSKAWPATTAARSCVILSKEIEYNSSHISTGGSFTVLNPNLINESNLGKSLPLGNVLFPELAKAVFHLETRLSQHQQRTATDHHSEVRHSSHCAINCNAQFTPHVDSGRGAGQSLSMIVGLGHYQGGELAVEGSFHNIQYRPLEFDGWKMRHWTLPFEGERFSLVWFTPHTETPATLPQ